MFISKKSRLLKKCLSVLLAVCIVFSSAYVGLNELDFSNMFAVRVNAAGVDDLTFTLNYDGESYSVTGCNTSAEGEIIIPDIYEGLPVTGIGAYAFWRCTNLISIKISNNVTSIGENAFLFCESLASLTIPDSVIIIGEGAFSYCESLDLVNITDIEAWLKIDFGDIRSNPVYYSNKLYLNGVLFNTAIIPESVISIGDYAFVNCTNLTAVMLHDSVESIGEGAFYGCINLENIDIPNSVISIGNHAFSNCDSFTTITIPKSLISIGDYTFFECKNIVSVVFEDNVTSIGECAFSYCESLVSVTIPDSVICIDNLAFNGCNELKYVFYTGSESDWENILLGSDNNNLVYANIHYNSNDHIYGDLLISATCEKDGVKYYECTLCGYINEIEKILAYGHIVSEWIIDSEASCTDCGLKHKECTLCGEVLETEVASAWGHTSSDWIVAIEPTCSECGLQYKECTVCGEELEHQEIRKKHVIVDSVCSLCGIAIWEYEVDNSQVKIIGYNGNDSFLEIPASIDELPVTSVGVGVFDGCTSLTSVTIPDGVKNIGDYAFAGCTNLKSVVLPDSVTSIGECVFQLCKNLESVRLPNGITSIEIDTFRDCRSLVSVVIPEGVTSIGIGAFSECESLTSIIIPDTVTNIGNYAFQSCKSLTSIVFEANITSIGKWAFSYCEKLTSVTIPKNIKSIGESSFSGCDELIYVFYGGSESEWTDVAIGSDNEQLTNAYIHYNATGHSYEITDTLATHPHTVTYTCFCGNSRTETNKDSKCLKCNFIITETNVGGYKLVSYIGTETNIIIPAYYEGYNIESISNSCFKTNRTITFVEIEEGVTSIGSLAFMNCTSLEKIVIPTSVTSIGTQAFYGFLGVIYCKSGSFAHEYAVANNIKYVLESTDEPKAPIQETANTQINYGDFLIFTDVKYSSDITEILGLSESATVVPTASSVYGNQELYGTGTIITVFDGNDYIGDFTLIVEGDLNGDSVVDVLDCAVAQLYSAGFYEPAENEVLAANGCISDEIDVNSYQNVVNTCLSE